MMCSYDNTETMCREIWVDGDFIGSYPASALGQDMPLMPQSLQLPWHPWEPGLVKGDPEAMTTKDEQEG